MSPTRRPSLHRWQRILALAVPLLVSAACAIVVARSLLQRQRAGDEVHRSLRTISLAEGVRLRMVDAETGQRGFIITGDPRYLEPYQGAARDVRRQLTDLRVLVRTDPADLRMVDSVAGIVDRRLDILERRIDVRLGQGFEAARTAVVTGGGREAMTRLRTTLDSMVAGERRKLAAREAEEARLAGLVFWLLSVGAVLVAGAVALTGSLFHRYAAAQREAADELEEANSRLQEQAVELEAQADEMMAQTVQLEETVAELEAVQEEMQEQNTQLELLRGELEEQNVALTRANAGLQEQTLRAEEANRAKADFLATMSHELRTPLNAVGGYADLLEMGVHGPVSDAQREALGRIRRNQRYLLGLIEDILSFARVEAGNIDVRLEPVPVPELLAGMEAVVAPLMATRRLEYRCDGSAAEMVVRGDRERIEQVLLNLLTNAAKFTPEGGQVRLWAEPAAAEVRIRVADTGRGIPAAQLQSVFEPFVQLQRTPSEGSAQGVGLGLAISRELARAMGGDLSVESEPGVGSTFTLTLPALAAEPGHPDPVAEMTG